MHPHRAVLQIPSKSSVPPGLPFYKTRPLLTPPKSTLLQMLIPLYFNSPRINTYKKTGRGSLLPGPKFCNSSLPTPRHCSLAAHHSLLATVPATSFPATLTDHSQLTENPSALSPLPATLTSHVKPNPCVCHSYKKHGGYILQAKGFSISDCSTCIGAYRPPCVRRAHFVPGLPSVHFQPPSATMPSAFRSYRCPRP